MDRASAGFESIAEMLLQQKKLMDALEAENRELRRQLAELRRGIGIAVVIEGRTIQLASGAGDPSFQNGLAALGGQSPAANQISQLNNQISQLNLGSSGSFSGMTPPPVPGTSSPLFAPDKPASNGSGNNNGRNPLADSFVL
ncbi:MAG TPA: hypothetical protein VH590_08610 [Ktedonobacterales bacterium]